MEWLISLLDEFCLDEKILPLLSIKRNSLLAESFERINLSFTRKKENLNKTTSICITPLIRVILQLTEEQISLQELIEKIRSFFPQLEDHKVLNLLRSLILEEVLFPTLLPTLITKLSHLMIF